MRAFFIVLSFTCLSYAKQQKESTIDLASSKSSLPIRLVKLSQEADIQKKIDSIDCNDSTMSQIHVNHQIVKLFLAKNNTKQSIRVGMPTFQWMWQRMKKNRNISPFLLYTIGLWKAMRYQPIAYCLSRISLAAILIIKSYLLSGLILICQYCWGTIVGLRQPYYSCLADIIVLPSGNYDLNSALGVAADSISFHKSPSYKRYTFWAQEYGIDIVCFLGKVFSRGSGIIVTLFLALEVIYFYRIREAYKRYQPFQTTYREQQTSQIQFILNHWDLNGELGTQLVQFFWFFASKNIGSMNLLVGFFFFFYSMIACIWLKAESFQQSEEYIQASIEATQTTKPVLQSNLGLFTLFDIGMNAQTAPPKIRKQLAFSFPDQMRDRENELVNQLAQFLAQKKECKKYAWPILKQVSEAVVDVEKELQAKQQKEYQEHIQELQDKIEKLLSSYNILQKICARDIMHCTYYIDPTYLLRYCSVPIATKINSFLLMVGVFGSNGNEEVERAVATLIIQDTLAWVKKEKEIEEQLVTDRAAIMQQRIKSTLVGSEIEAVEVNKLVDHITGQKKSQKIKEQLEKIQEDREISHRSTWNILGIIHLFKVFLSLLVLPKLFKKIVIYGGTRIEKIVKIQIEKGRKKAQKKE